MKSVIRRRGLYLNLPALWYIHGTWTRELGLARVFRSRREAAAYLAGSELPRGECEVVELVPADTPAGCVLTDPDTGRAVLVSGSTDDRAEPVPDEGTDRPPKKRPKPWQQPRN